MFGETACETGGGEWVGGGIVIWHCHLASASGIIIAVICAVRQPMRRAAGGGKHVGGV